MAPCSKTVRFPRAQPQPPQVSQPEDFAPAHRCLRPASLQSACCVSGAEGRGPLEGSWEPCSGASTAMEAPKFRSLHSHGGPGEGLVLAWTHLGCDSEPGADCLVRLRRPAALGGPGREPEHPEFRDRKQVQRQEAWSPCPKLPMCHISWDKSSNKLGLSFLICDSEADRKPLKVLPCGVQRAKSGRAEAAASAEWRRGWGPESHLSDGLVQMLGAPLAAALFYLRDGCPRPLWALCPGWGWVVLGRGMWALVAHPASRGFWDARKWQSLPP